MSLKQPPPPSDLFSPDLLRSLEATVAFAREKAADRTGSLAVVHVLQGVTQEQWEYFASAHNLASWLAVPLDTPQEAAMASLCKTFENLALQRDYDALTGVGNRGYFDRQLARELERAARSHTELSLVMIDIDLFKNVNDTYGHSYGDTVLQRLATTLQNHIRPYDTLARLGGEEFAVILPATPSWTAQALVKRILEAFGKEEFSCDGKTFHVTFSGGIASLGLLAETPTPDLLLKSADTALYAAKAQGRNKVVMMESKTHKNDRGTLVRSHEKQFLFSCQGLE